MYCRNCGNELPPNGTVCLHCGVPAGQGNHFCPQCKAETDPQAVICVKCGAQLGTPPTQVAGGQKSRLVAGLLGILVGWLGIHNFYLGYTTKGVIQLLLGVLGGLITCGIATFAAGIWGLVEGIMILTGSISVDANNQPLGN